jgi:hypothetical protein
MKRILVALIFILAFAGISHAQTINVGGCTAALAQTAFNAVAADGTTVVFPSCAANSWSTTVTYNQVFSTTIQGQSTTTGTCAPGGSCSAVDNTNIVDAMARGGGGCGTDPAMLQINTAASKSFRMTGMSFTQTGDQTCSGSIRVNGKSQLIRIDHNHFNKIFSTPLGVNGWTLGVIDHNFFEAPNAVWNAVKFGEGGWNNDSLGVGDQSWAAATAFGTGGFMFVENNEFHSAFPAASSYANDCTDGGRYVWRYNLEVNTWHQTHPTGGGARHRGCRAVEIYNNTDTGTGGVGANFNFMWMSSGGLLIWGNTVDSTFSHFVTLHSMRRDNSTYMQGATPGGWGYSGTSFDGVGSNWDQNTSTTTGYRSLDQPGQGVGQLLVNDFPSTVNSVTGTIAWPNEALEPVYEWINNSTAGNFWDNADATATVANSDYYLYTLSFTGATGTGSGLLSARPGTCTAGVAYWGTDTTTLYKCGPSANTWATYYTPYTYPHPLDTSGGGVASFSPSTLSFGNIVQFIPSSGMVSTLTNSSGSTITYSSIGVSGTNASDFVETGTTCASFSGGTLANGASCTVTVTFTPTATPTTLESAILSVTFTGGSGSPAQISLNGTSIASTLNAPSVFPVKFMAVPLPAVVTPPVITLTKSSPASSYVSKLGISQDGKTFVPSLVMQLTGTNFSLTGASCTWDGTSVGCSCGSASSCIATVPAALIPIPTVSTAHTLQISFPAVVAPVIPVVN